MTDKEEGPVKFSEMPYKRPDPEAVKAELKELTGRLQSAKSYEEARAVFLDGHAGVHPPFHRYPG